MTVHKYSKESIKQLTDVVHRWQQGYKLSSTDGALLSTLITNVSRDRWYKHFGNRRSDWQDTQTIREWVPLAFMDYLLYPRSVRTVLVDPITRKRVYSCPVTVEREYSSLPAVLHEFRLQFPRIITVLTSRHVGVTLLEEWQPRNIRYMTNLPVYQELHRASVILRKIASTDNRLLYSPERYDSLDVVATVINNGKELRVKRVLSTPAKYSRVTVRRATATLAACDILASRVHSHYNATPSNEVTIDYDC
jgi:hypothetical protein